MCVELLPAMLPGKKAACKDRLQRVRVTASSTVVNCRHADALKMVQALFLMQRWY
jgi:hypothetical protein